MRDSLLQVSVCKPIKRLRAFYNEYVNAGQERSVRAKQQILAMFFVRIASVSISFILVPLTIHYVSTVSYGIWLTLSSIVGWSSVLNLRVNNSLRNKLTEAIAMGDINLAQRYVSTTYALLSLIFLPLSVILLVVSYQVDWPQILNCPPEMLAELSAVSSIVFGYFCIRFILSTINIVLLSYQLPASEAMRGLGEQMVSLLVIVVLTKTTQGSLLKLTVGLCVAPLVVLFGYNLSLFNGRFRMIKPTIASIDWTLVRDLLGLGFRFFVIQIAGIVQFQTANVLIIRSFGPNEVTAYNMAFKYFSITTLTMGIALTPLWSAVTDAYARRDIDWIVRSVVKYQWAAVVIVAFGAVMLLLSDQAYSLWLGGNRVHISFSMSLAMFVFSMVSVFGGVYSGVLNGIGALRLQVYASLLSPILFVSASYFLVNKCHWGAEAIAVGSIIANFNAYILAPIQFYKIFGRRRSVLGAWSE